MPLPLDHGGQGPTVITKIKIPAFVSSEWHTVADVVKYMEAHYTIA